MNDHNHRAPGDIVVGALAFAVLFFFVLPDVLAWLAGALPVLWP